ncbi:MAG: Sec-independent protein translocase protein TatB [Ilumatobacteraceae bacterium]
MFNLSGSEIVIILLLALVVLGPEKLPDAIRRFGRIYGELRRMGSGFQSEFRNALDEPLRELRQTAQLTRDTVLNTVNEPKPDGAASITPASLEPATREDIGSPPDLPGENDPGSR